MYINEIKWKTLGASTLCYSICHKVTYFLSLNFSHIVQVSILATGKKFQEFSQLYLTSCNYIIGEEWLVVLGVHLDTFVGLFLPFLSSGDDHGT